MTESSIKFNKRKVICCLLVLAFAACAAVTFRPSASAQANVEKAVRDVLMQSTVGFERGDLAALNKVWANDEALVVFEQGHANYGWTDYRDRHLVPEMREMKNTKYTLSDVRVHTAGKTAWATFKYAISADIEKRHVDGGGLGTAVLEERDGRWQIVHWHSSAPRRTPAKPS